MELIINRKFGTYNVDLDGGNIPTFASKEAALENPMILSTKVNKKILTFYEDVILNVLVQDDAVYTAYTREEEHSGRPVIEYALDNSFLLDISQVGSGNYVLVEVIHAVGSQGFSVLQMKRPYIVQYFALSIIEETQT